MKVLLLRPVPSNERFGLGPFFRIEPLGLEYIAAALETNGHQVGAAQNYGRPGNIVNYQETVNHALDRAAAEIVTSSDLIEQLCGT